MIPCKIDSEEEAKEGIWGLKDELLPSYDVSEDEIEPLIDHVSERRVENSEIYQFLPVLAKRELESKLGMIESYKQEGLS